MGLWVGSQMAEEADLRREGFPGSVDKGWMPHRVSGSRWLWTFWPVSVARAATAVLLVSQDTAPWRREERHTTRP